MKKYKLELELTEKAAEGILIRSGIYGLTPSELLETFIEDLLWTDRCEGSDEHDLAEKWCDRHIFAHSYEDKTFLQHLIIWDRLEEFIKQAEYLERRKKKLEEAKTDPEATENDIKTLEVDISETKDFMQAMFDYYDSSKNHSDDFLEEIKSIRDWMDLKKKFLKGKE